MIIIIRSAYIQFPVICSRCLGFYYYYNGCPPQSVKHSTPRDHLCHTSGQHSHEYPRSMRLHDEGTQGYSTTRLWRYRCHSSRDVRSAVGDYDGEGYTFHGGHGRTGVASISYSGRYDELGRRRRRCLMMACSGVGDEGGDEDERHGTGDLEGSEGGSRATHVNLSPPPKTRVRQ